jgi:CBS domain-containing protein
MKIQDVMSTDVETVTPETSIHDVAKIMKDRDCGCVVVTKDDRLIGIITDRDIALRYVTQKPNSEAVTAEKVMTPDILYCKETDNTDDVARNMADNKVRRLPVLNAEKRLVGIVSLGDLASQSNDALCGEVLGDICRAA